MPRARPQPVIHLELHTADLRAARALYGELCGWETERVATSAGDYVALGLAAGIGGGIVECATGRALWLPYVEVADVRAATERGRALGAEVLLEPRSGPAGRRSVIATPAGGEIALWEHRR